MSGPGLEMTPVAPAASGLDLAALEVPHPAPMILEHTIRASQMSDVIDHVSNIEYVRWLDRSAELHADALGFSRRWQLEQGLMWFVARHEIDYRAEVGLGDRLLIVTRVRDVRRVKSWRDYVVVRPADGEAGGTVVCRAATLWVLVSLESRRPVRFTDEMIERFAPLDRRDEQSCTSP